MSVSFSEWTLLLLEESELRKVLLKRDAGLGGTHYHRIAALVVAQWPQTRTICLVQDGAQTGPKSMERCHSLHIGNKNPKQQNPELLLSVEILVFLWITNWLVMFEIKCTSYRAFLNILKVIWGKVKKNGFSCTVSNGSSRSSLEPFILFIIISLSYF